MAVVGTGVFADLSATVGVPESSLRLLVSLFAGYPFALIHRHLLFGKSANLQHIYFIASGLWLSYFNFGGDTIHSVVNISLVYVILRVFGGSVLSLITCFVLNLVYLSVGNYVMMTASYDISWTMPQCVLLLKLTALAFDVYDGTRKQESLSPEQRETALSRLPTLLEVFGQSYFFGSFLVGPHFSMTRYLNFTSGTLLRTTPNCVAPAMRRLALGVFYTLLFQVTNLYLPETYMLTASFNDRSFLGRCMVIAVWSKVTLYKYVACWIITEGSCILTGLTYNGRADDGVERWDGCANILVADYERASSATQIVQSFNVNTNRWMAKYVFKRLKFLGNKDLSQTLTLAFLAVWHGFSSGYFVTFSYEFFIIKLEREVSPLLERTAAVRLLNRHAVGVALLWCVNKFYAQFMLGYGLLGFCLFTFDRYWQAYSSMYFVLHLAPIAWLLLRPLLAPASSGPPAHSNSVKRD